MPLPAGARLGSYEILSFIGAGGMGEVYRARDLRLKRDVAVKVLPDTFAIDAERLARFQREAEVLATLNHPSIAQVYGLEDRALVLELVEGPTLAARIAQGPIPIDEALTIARQIAEALEAAHDRNVIHRDLKPSNVMMTPDGAVKVLDFGLAKTVDAPAETSAARSMSPTITSPLQTQLGGILGTAAYMAPEQAKGLTADRRSDVWAFGCVLYAMLTGRKAFEGEDVSDTLAAVLRSEPQWDALPRQLAPRVARLIKRLLEKDRKRRVSDFGTVLFALSEPSEAAPETRERPLSGRRVVLSAILTIAAIAVVAASGWWIGARSRAGDTAREVTRFAVALRGDEQFSTLNFMGIAISTDGRHLAYVANRQLNIRSLDRLEPVVIRSSDGAGSPPVSNPFFSPDGRWIGFWQQGQIKKVSVGGGVPVTVAEAVNAATGGFAWEDDHTVVFSDGVNVMRVAEGSTPEVIIAKLNGRATSLQLLPGRLILFTLFPNDPNMPTEVVIRSLDTGEQHTLLRGAINARYVTTGHLVYFAETSLRAVPFDIQTLTVTGGPVPFAEDVANIGVPGRTLAAAHFAMSASGTLAYISGSFRESGSRTLVWVDRRGREEPVGPGEAAYVYPRLSPDGSRIALTIRDRERDVWLLDVRRQALSRFTFEPDEDRHAIWTPDGKGVVFSSQRNKQAGVWWQVADLAAQPEKLGALTITDYGNFMPTSISPDGSQLVTYVTGPAANGGSDIWTVALNGSHKTTPLLEEKLIERNGELSPDGRWLAYEAGVGTEMNVYVRPFPNVNDARHQVSTGGGFQPLWSRNGKEVFFFDSAGALITAPVESLSPLVIGTPVKIFEGSYVSTLPTYAGRMYDAARDGQRFLMMKQFENQAAGPTTITVVQNWTEELRRLVPAK